MKFTQNLEQSESQQNSEPSKVLQKSEPFEIPLISKSSEAFQLPTSLQQSIKASPILASIFQKSTFTDDETKTLKQSKPYINQEHSIATNAASDYYSNIINNFAPTFSKGGKISTKIIVIIVVFIVLSIIIAAILIFLFLKKKRSKQDSKNQYFSDDESKKSTSTNTSKDFYIEKDEDDIDLDFWL